MVMFGVIFFRAVVPAGALRRTVRPAGQRQPRPRPADPGAARADPRPRRPADRRRAARPTRCRSCRRRCRRRARRAWRCTAASAALLGMSAAPRSRRSSCAAARPCPYAPVTIKTDAGPGVLTVLGERQNEFPGRRPAAGLDPRLPLRRDGRAGARLRRPDLRTGARRCAPSAACTQGTVVGQEGLEYYYDRYLRGRTGRAAGRGQRRRATRCRASLAPTPADGRAQPQADARPRPAEGGRKGAAGRRSNGRAPAANRRPRARSWRSTRATGRCWRSAPTPSFDPNKFAKPLTEARIRSARGQRLGRRAADRPRRQRRLPDRLDVQADHRDGGARSAA